MEDDRLLALEAAVEVALAGGDPHATEEVPSEAPPVPVLGACYNVFDAEELLEASVQAIRPLVRHVVVVYQTVSNFGESNDALLPVLTKLRSDGLVDELIEYHPKMFTNAEKKALVSPRTTGADLGGAKAEDIADQFMNEVSKRELGRQACVARGCTHFMCLDVDEFYMRKDLECALQKMNAGGYHVGVCRMRFFFRRPEWELMPMDDTNYVPALYKCDPDMMFKVGCPYPVLIDPTRKLHNATRLLDFPREELEMYHYSFVRNDIRRKVSNVSNRVNYHDGGKIAKFLRQFKMWTPKQALISPNPFFEQQFSRVRVVRNYFGITVGCDVPSTEPTCAVCGKPGTLRCSRCQEARYCSGKCQRSHWPEHKKWCKKVPK